MDIPRPGWPKHALPEMPTFQLITPCSSMRGSPLEKCASNVSGALPRTGRNGTFKLGSVRTFPPSARADQFHPYLCPCDAHTDHVNLQG
jgi:hypothetical protein